MTLIRLRRGIDTTTLGAMFGVKAGTVSKYFFTWTTFLYFELKFLISWPSRYQTVQNLPKCFKYFPSTRCIIDCTEFFVQKPSIPSSQRITWSSYKHHNTFKSLVAITPKGSFCFLSNLFTGSISDKLFSESNNCHTQRYTYLTLIKNGRSYLIECFMNSIHLQILIKKIKEK